MSFRMEMLLRMQMVDNQYFTPPPTVIIAAGRCVGDSHSVVEYFTCATYIDMCSYNSNYLCISK